MIRFILSGAFLILITPQLNASHPSFCSEITDFVDVVELNDVYEVEEIYNPKTRKFEYKAGSWKYANLIFWEERGVERSILATHIIRHKNNRPLAYDTPDGKKVVVFHGYGGPLLRKVVTPKFKLTPTDLDNDVDNLSDRKHNCFDAGLSVP